MTMLRADEPFVQSRPAEDWPESPNIDGYNWELCSVPSDDDARWWAERNDDWDGHPVIDDQTIADEAVHREEEARRFAAEPTQEEINRWADERAAESEFLDQHEAGLGMY